jgi:hypothetical protein
MEVWARLVITNIPRAFRFLSDGLSDSKYVTYRFFETLYYRE